MDQPFFSGDHNGITFYGNDYPQLEEDKIEDDMGAADARGRFLGPLGILAKKDTDPSWDIVNTVFGNAADPTFVGAKYAFNAEDIGRQHMMMVTFENQANISYDIEIVRHYEIIPGEDAAMETKTCLLSYKYTSALDIIRQYNIESLLANPFAPNQMSTSTTIWKLDHIYSANMKDIHNLMKQAGADKEERIKGLIGQGLKWLLRLIAPALLQKAGEKIEKYTEPK